MKKLLEVREFDSITCNENYKDNADYWYIEEKNFESLKNFIKEFSETQEHADALNVMRLEYRRNPGSIITFRNYVGVIQLNNGFQVQVLPKISFSDGEDIGNVKTKMVFLKMLRSMKDFPSKVFNDAKLKVSRMNLYEIFISMYLQEVRHLVKSGLKSAYIEQEDNLRFYKGKLKVSNHIRYNASHKERFYLAYDEFHLNRSENKLVKSTLLKLQKQTTSAENSKEIRQLLTSFEMVDPSTNYQKDFSLSAIDRNTRDYATLIPWSKVFLLNNSFSTFSGESDSKALLFPMESVYENYVSRMMKKVFAVGGWDVLIQDKGHYLFVEPRNQFALRPDIVIRRENRTVILDTKWKLLIPDERKNYGISQSDMYQMYAYSKKYQTPEIWILYPLNEGMRDYGEISFDSGDGTKVSVFLVDVVNIEKSLTILKKKIEETKPYE